jgi:16S rRNA C1402 N4-methylase RsmH
MAQNIIKHYPVMAGNAIQKIKKCFTSKPIKVADCNFGFGGHTKLILKNFPRALVYLSLQTGRLTT